MNESIPIPTVFFSIIIPTFNAAGTLAQTLESIGSQTFKNIEVLILDAVSSDDSIAIAKAYANTVNLRIVSEKDTGIYDAMNKGILLAKGQWVFFLGSDDIFYNSHVLNSVASNINEQVDIVYGDSIWLPENMREAGEWNFSRLLKQSINHQRIFYRKILFEKYGAFNTIYRIAADYELNIRFFCNDRIHQKHIPQEIVYYHSGGFSANKIDEVFWANWKSILVDNFKGHLPVRKIYARINWYCWHQINSRHYQKAFLLFVTIFWHTQSFSFVKHSISQLLKISNRYKRY